MNKHQGGEEALLRLASALEAQSKKLPLCERILSSSLGRYNSLGSIHNGDDSTAVKGLLKAANQTEESSINDAIKRLQERIQQKTNGDKDNLFASTIQLLTKLVKAGSNDNKKESKRASEQYGRKLNNLPMQQQSSPTCKFASNISSSSAESHIHQAKAIVMEIQKQQIMVVRECIYALEGINGSFIHFNYNNNQQVSISINFPEWIQDNSISAAFYSYNEHQRKVAATATLASSPPNEAVSVMCITKDAIRLCAECGKLFLTLTLMDNADASMIARALSEALSQELEDYHGLVAQLESQASTLTLNRLVFFIRPVFDRLAALVRFVFGCRQNSHNGPELASAMHLHVQHTVHQCNASHVAVLERLANRAFQPLYHRIYQWVFYGLLQKQQRLAISNHQSDFFIVEYDRVPDAYLWGGEAVPSSTADVAAGYNHRIMKRYTLDDARIPIFIPWDIANLIYNIGKGVNFVRKCLASDADVAPTTNFSGERVALWDLMTEFLAKKKTETNENEMDQQDNFPSFESMQQALGMTYSASSNQPTKLLYTTLCQCQTIVHNRIRWELMEHQTFSLPLHLLALKNIILMCQGDFSQEMVEILGPSSQRSGMHRYAMQQKVDTILNSTNTKFFPEAILARVEVTKSTHQFQSSTERGSFSVNSHTAAQTPHSTGSYLSAADRVWETEWGGDDFLLHYKVDAPLTAVVHPSAVLKYHKMFQLLWKCKKLEGSVSQTWRNALIVNRAVMSCRPHPRHFYGSQNVSVESVDTTTKEYKLWKRALAVLRKIAMTRQSVKHFVSNLLSYLSYEVLEKNWSVLQYKLDQAKTLDDLVNAHDDYLNNLISSSLLLRPDDHVADVVVSPVIAMTAIQLTNVMDMASKFVSAEEAFFKTVINSIQDAQTRRRKAERKLKEGKWGYQGINEDEDQMDLMVILRSTEHNAKIGKCAKEFDGSLRRFLEGLMDRIDGSSTTSLVGQTPASATDTGSAASPSETQSVSSAGSVMRLKHQQQQQSSLSGGEVPISPSRRNQFATIGGDRKDDALRFLSFRLDFNQFYEMQKPYS